MYIKLILIAVLTVTLFSNERKGNEQSKENNIYGATLDTTKVGPQSDYKLPKKNYILIHTTDDATSVISNAGEGSVFIFEAGVHTTCVKVRPKNNMKFYGQKGAILDGSHTADYCFIYDSNQGGNSCTLANLEVRNYSGGQSQDACLKLQDAGGGWTAVYNRKSHDANSGWLIENMAIHHNGFVGLFIGGHTIVRNCIIAFNGHVGMKATGYNSIITSNYIHHNNAANFETGWESGGIKVFSSENLSISNNIFLDNNGPGIWFDYNYDGHYIHHNTITGNADAGINFEMVCGKNDWYKKQLGREQKVPIIEYNLIQWNGWSKVGNTLDDYPEAKESINKFWSSKFWQTRHQNVDWLYGGFHCHDGGPVIFRNNKLENNFGGVVLQYQKRNSIDPNKQMSGSKNGPTGTLTGIQIQDNIFNEFYGYSGFHFVAYQEWQPKTEINMSDLVPELNGFKFSGNTYNFDNSHKYFKYAYDKSNGNSNNNNIWDYFECDLLDIIEWQNIAGQDN